MADTAVAITAGSGTNIDTRTEATNGDHRQVIVIGDPSTNAGVAPVDATSGLKVNLGVDNDVSLNAGTNYVGKVRITDGTNDHTLVATVGDAVSNPSNVVGAGAFLLGWNTTNWERIRSNIGDGASSTGMLNVVGMVYNGSTYDRAPGTTAGMFVQRGITGGADGVTTVTTAGTDVALASSTACKGVFIQAQTDNTGLIAVGATGVDATEATGTGIILYPGDSIYIEVDDLDVIFIDSTVNGEGVRYFYLT